MEHDIGSGQLHENAKRYVSARYGILGGTFNPIHNGHIEMAECALSQFKLDAVLMMPNSLPYYKDADGLSDVHRANMVKLAARGRDGLVYSDIEIARGGVTYTVDTLEYLHRECPGIEWYFIMGGDSLIYFDTWKSPEIIAKLAVLVVAARKGVSDDAVRRKADELRALYEGIDIRFEAAEIDGISSSEIRSRLAQGMDVSGLLPDNVAGYIDCHGLYR